MIQPLRADTSRLAQYLPSSCDTLPDEWLGLGQLPRVGAPPERSYWNKKVLSCFEFFLTQGTPRLLAGALQRIREKAQKEKILCSEAFLTERSNMWSIMN